MESGDHGDIIIFKERLSPWALQEYPHDSLPAEDLSGCDEERDS